MPAIREALKRSPFIHLLGKELKTSMRVLTDEMRHRNWKRQRERTIDGYLTNSVERKLHVGCGPMVMQGWLNTDMVPDHDHGVVYLDITEPLPFKAESFHYIYSEHLIEHISLDTGLRHLKDCHRILKPGGVIRTATPDLKFLLDYFSGSGLSEVQRGFLQEMIEESHPGLLVRSPTILLNRFVRDWGHQFIYDYDVLRHSMEGAGFANIVSCKVKESRHPALKDLERHGSAISDRYNELQTMILEGTKEA